MLLCAAQCLLILAARHHYTVDVVVALYTVPLLWSWWSRTFPDDLAPNDARVATFVLRRGRGRGVFGRGLSVGRVGPRAALELAGVTPPRKFSSCERLRPTTELASELATC